MESEEQEKVLNPEVIRSEIEQKADKFLEPQKSFNGRRYGALDLPASAIAEWEERPVINEETEPLQIKADVRVILTAQEEREKKPAYKSVQLHISPAGEQPRVRHVYILNLTKDKSPELTYYENRPIGPEGAYPGESAPMMPFGMTTTKASVRTLQAFNKFLDQAKPQTRNS